MRVMMRWSPMSSVFSIEPEGMTRAWPMAPLISKKTSPTQNQAMTSRWIFVFTGTFASAFFDFSVFSVFSTSAFTMHHHRPFSGRGFPFHCNRSFRGFAVGIGPANLQLHKIGRVNPRITRRTEPVFGISDGLLEGRKREIAEGVRAEELADLLGRIGRGNQLLARGRVHAVVAGGNRGRATDAHVDFFGSGIADHAHYLAAGRAADNGVVHQHDALAFDEAAHGVELELDAEIADGLRGLDERATDIVIADQAHAEWNLGFERVADGGGNTGVGHG